MKVGTGPELSTPKSTIKDPYDFDTYEQKNLKLEQLVREKWMAGEIDERKPGHDNFYCQLIDDNGVDTMQSKPQPATTKNSTMKRGKSTTRVRSSEVNQLEYEQSKRRSVEQNDTPITNKKYNGSSMLRTYTEPD